MDETQTVAKKRSVALDFLRGAAIFLVLGHHSNMLIPVEKSGYCYPLADFFQRFGWTGVDLFFTLSGFLIGGLLFRELRLHGELRVKRFIIRRGLKIWPLYYLYLSYLLFYPMVHSHISFKAAFLPLIPNFLHIQNYVYMHHEHTWTLSLEEHFYLMLPLLLWALNRKQKLHWIPAIYCVLAVTCLTLRFWTLQVHPWRPDGGLQWGWKTFTPTHLRIDALMFGVLLAYYFQFRPEVFERLRSSAGTRWAVAAVGLLLVSLAYWFPHSGPNCTFIATFGLIAVYLGYGCILMSCVHSENQSENETKKSGRFFRSVVGRGVAFVGFYSYSIYLWHIDESLRRVLHLVYTGRFNGLDEGTRWIVVLSMYMGLAVLVGVIVSRLVELPVLALREKLFPDTSKTTT